MHLMKDEKNEILLFYLKRIYNNSNCHIKKNHVFISSQVYCEFYKNGK